VQVCTIIAKNYLAYARVLARSLAGVQPTDRLAVLVIDDFAGYIDPDAEPFDVLTPAAIGCEPFTAMALRYSVLELSTAVKPWLMRHLLQATGAPVTYLDPDICVYGSLEELDRLAACHRVVLTPHNCRPIPADGRRPSQVDVMIAGVYNLGYLSLAPGEEVDELLAWWSDRLRRDCRVDPVWGYFVDQRWFDLVPGFVSDPAILREPQYNVAYWNLHERRLQEQDGSYLVDGSPLGFFHFSGFDPERPLVLSRHQDRIDAAADPVLERLLADYAHAVIEQGHRQSRRWPYTFAALADGTRLDERLRELFDRYAQEHDDVVPSPFTPEGVRAFDEWLLGRQPGAPPGINRALAWLYERRADLRGAFPDIAGQDREPFLAWAREIGPGEEPLLARLAPRLRAAAPEAGGGGSPGAAATGSSPSGDGSSARPSSWAGAPWGVNLVLDPSADAELAAASWSLVKALDLAGVRSLPVASWPVEPCGAADAPPWLAERRPGPEMAPFALDLLCADPQRLAELAIGLGPGRGRYTIALWLWPYESLPPALWDRLLLLDEVWVPSRHVEHAVRAAATRSGTDVAVHALGLPIALDAGPPRTRAELDLPEDELLFHVLVDHRSGFERQNPLAAIEAFGRAFGPGEGAGLVVECLSPEAAPAHHAELVRAAARHRDVRLLERAGAGDRAETVALLALCDCHVSLHRAVAFGIWPARAMWLAKPVIATGYSGNLEYMNEENSHLVRHTMVDVEGSPERVAPGGRWAAPDGAHAAELMRTVFEDPAAGRALGTRAAASIRASHGAQVRAAALSRRMESIRGVGRPRRPPDPIRRRPRALASLPMRLAEGPPPVGGGRAAAARERLRRAVLRLMRPYTAFQGDVNAQLLAALAELDSEVDRLRLDLAAGWAEVLSGWRSTAPPAAEDERLARLQEAVDEIRRRLTFETDRDLYLALGELARRHAAVATEPAAPPSERALGPFELRALSQNGEDGVLVEILRRIGVRARYFVEFGVESGREGNCVYLADFAGWRGLFMEAGEEPFRELERKYAARPQVKTLRARVSASNIERLLDQAEVPAEPDVLCIDVDGQDYWIWRALQRRPRVVVIEYNSALPPRSRLVQPEDPGWEWDGSDRYGASLGALCDLAEEKGYRLVHTEHNAVNAFFVRCDLLADRFPAPDEVPGWGQPNFYGRGVRHPPARPPGRYLDLQSGRLVRAADEPGAERLA
jgi:hypothetical protein